jgi:soluble lytic murein transglycosylase-like protein
MKAKFCGTILSLSSLLFPLLAALAEAKIYVVREAGGVVRFTNRAPSAGTRSEVFTARNRSKVSYYSASPFGGRGGGKVYPHLFHSVIERAAGIHGVSPGLVKAVIHVESGFNPRAVSPKGARGLMQLMPGTARSLGVTNSFSPAHNILGGTKHLARLLQRFKGDTRLALAAYNAGEEAVARHRGIPPYRETINYVRRVLALQRRYGTVQQADMGRSARRA